METVHQDIYMKNQKMTHFFKIKLSRIFQNMLKKRI